MDKLTSSIKNFLTGSENARAAEHSHHAKAESQAGGRPDSAGINLYERDAGREEKLAETSSMNALEYASERDDAWADALSREEFERIVARFMGGIDTQYAALQSNNAIASFNYTLKNLKEENQVGMRMVQHLGRIYVNGWLPVGPNAVLSDAQVLSVLHKAVHEMGDREPLRFHTYFFTRKTGSS